MLSGDGLITENSTLVLGAVAADCMPIYFFDSKNKVFGIVHSGWKGTGIIAEAVGILQSRWGTAMDDLTVVLGPSAGVCCYEVDETRYRDFTSRWGEKSGERRKGKFYLDLKSANYSSFFLSGYIMYMISMNVPSATKSMVLTGARGRSVIQGCLH